MATGYHYPNDGRLHCRYSELRLCTPSQISRLVAYRLGMEDPYTSEAMAFGSSRHAELEAEVRRTRQLPAVFQDLPTGRADIDYIEREFAVELVRGVVVHSRPDAVSRAAKTIYDYKTVSTIPSNADKKIQSYWSSNQLPFYALVLSIHGIEITKAVYLCEVWNAERDKILGHRQVVRDIRPEHIERVRDWAKQRIALLKVAMQQAREVSV